MAQERIEIKFIPTGNVPLVKAIKELHKATQQLNGQLNKLNATNVKVAQTQNLVNKRVSSNTAAVNANSTAYTRLQATISVYRNKMLLAGFATALIIRPLIELTALFGKFEDLEIGFINLGRSIGATSEHLNKLRTATDGTVSDMELMRLANNAMMLGVVKSEDEMSLLFDAAQRMGQALGRDAVSSIESMVSGMGRQSKMMLDNIGIMVDVNKSYENFATENEKAANSLTDFEKKQAFNNEVLKQSKEALKKLGDEVLTTSQKVQIIDNSVNRLAIAFGEALAPIVTVLSKVLSTLADIIDGKTIKSVGVLIASFAILKVAAIAAAIGLGKIALTLGAGLVIFAPYIAAFVGLVAVLNATIFAESELEKIERVKKERQEKIIELGKANIPVLQKELDLLNAKTDAEKRAIQLDRPLIDGEIEIINAINAKKEALKLETELLKQKEKHEKNILAIIKESAMFGKDRALESLKEKESLIAAEINHAEAIMHRSMMDGESTEESARMAGLLDKLKMSHMDITDEIDRYTESTRKKTDEELLNEGSLKKVESAYQRTKKAQMELLAEQIKAAEAMKGLTPEQLEGIKEMKKEFLELAFDFEIPDLSDVKDAMSEYLQGQIEETRAAAEAKMAIYDQEANARIEALKKSRKWDKKSKSQQESEIDAINKKTEKKKAEARKEANKEMLTQFRLNQGLSIAEAVINTSQGYTKALAQGGIGGIPMAAIVATLGAAQVAMIAAQKPPKMAQGGLVGGKLHSQGGTMIEAEQGEFVMNRDAVDAIGTENLNRMNRGGGGGANISFSGNVMSDDFIENEAIPKIKEAVRRGSDIGVS